LLDPELDPLPIDPLPLDPLPIEPLPLLLEPLPMDPPDEVPEVSLEFELFLCFLCLVVVLPD
jgi:hypothetical protein